MLSLPSLPPSSSFHKWSNWSFGSKRYAMLCNVCEKTIFRFFWIFSHNQDLHFQYSRDFSIKNFDEKKCLHQICWSCLHLFQNILTKINMTRNFFFSVAYAKINFNKWSKINVWDSTPLKHPFIGEGGLQLPCPSSPPHGGTPPSPYTDWIEVSSLLVLVKYWLTFHNQVRKMCRSLSSPRI